MLSNTLNSLNDLYYSYCHLHFKEKQVEAEKRLSNLPKITDELGVKVRFGTSDLSGDLKDTINSHSPWGSQRGQSKSCEWRMWFSCRNYWGAVRNALHMHIWLSGLRQTSSLPCASALPTVKSKTEIVATYPPACSQEWDKSSQLLYKKQLSFQPLAFLTNVEGSKSSKKQGSSLLSWIYCSDHPALLPSSLCSSLWPYCWQTKGSKFKEYSWNDVCISEPFVLAEWLMSIYLTTPLDTFQVFPSDFALSLQLTGPQSIPCGPQAYTGGFASWITKGSMSHLFCKIRRKGSLQQPHCLQIKNLLGCWLGLI